jgi:hypothetical protein
VSWKTPEVIAHELVIVEAKTTSIIPRESDFLMVPD